MNDLGAVEGNQVVTINEQEQKAKYSLLTEYLGYKITPVDIMTFCKDPYYLGNAVGINEETGDWKLYKIWRDRLQETFPTPFTVKSYISVNGCIGCLHKDTKIKLLDGRSISIENLYKEYEDNPNKSLWVYSWDQSTNTWKPGKIAKVWDNGVKDLLELELSIYNSDNTYKIRCTPIHKFLLTNGKYVEAKDLISGDSIQSIYIKDKCDSHTVISVKKAEPDHVYDLTVEEYHNYGIEDPLGNLCIVHNCGKTTYSKICLLYTLYKVLCLKNPYNTFHLAPKYICFAIFNMTKEKAQLVTNELWEWINDSPYFQEQMHDGSSYFNKCMIMPCAQEKDITSNDVLFVMLSEINDKNVSVDYAINLINIVDSRRESRFPGDIMDQTFPMTILDSSDTYQESACNWYRLHHPKAPKTLFYTCAIWQAKPDEYFHKPDENGKLTFTFYCGDSTIFPGIVGETVTAPMEKLDPDRIIEAPNELIDLARANPERFATEKCGRSLSTTGKWLNPTLVKPAFKLEMPDLMPMGDIKVAFHDPNDTLIQFGFEEALNSIPYDAATFVALDYATTGDKAGFSVGYIESMGYHEIGGEQVRNIKCKIPIATSFGRYPGEETSAQKIIDLVMYIHSKRPIAEFSCDRHQSVPIKQTLELQGINCSFRSIEHDMPTWNMFKNMLYAGQIDIVKNDILYNELIHLMDLGTRIDHVEVADESGLGSNSKDITDAIVRNVMAMFQAKEEMTQPTVVSSRLKDQARDNAIAAVYEHNRLETMKMMAAQQSGMNVNSLKNNRIMDTRFALGNIWKDDDDKEKVKDTRKKSEILYDMMNNAKQLNDMIGYLGYKKKWEQAIKDEITEGDVPRVQTLME